MCDWEGHRGDVWPHIQRHTCGLAQPAARPQASPFAEILGATPMSTPRPHMIIIASNQDLVPI